MSASRARCGGAASAEWLVVAPAVLVLGFGILQWALLMHGRASVEYAAFEGARAGATAHADPDAIVAGMATGLIGIRGANLAAVPVSASRAAAVALLRDELVGGVARWRQRRPASEDFADWAQPAVDEDGWPLPGVVEIPNDNLRYRGGARGPSSGRSLVEANVLEVELVYAWPMRVPLIGALAVRWMEWLDGCDGVAAEPSGYELWGRPDWRIEGGAWRCAYYRAGGSPRWPLRVVARARMHSAARHAGAPGGNVPGVGPSSSLPATAPGGPASGGGEADEGGVAAPDVAMGPIVGVSPGTEPGVGAGPVAATRGEADMGVGPGAAPGTSSATTSGSQVEAVDDIGDRADITQPGACFAQAEAEAETEAGPPERPEGAVES